MANLSNPYWYKLIKQFKAASQPYKITTGLTIPFLFGAYKELESPFNNIEALLKCIIESEIDKYPIIQRCHVIGKHVVMVEDKFKCNKEFKDFPPIESDNKKNKLLISTNTNIGKTFDKVCNSLRLEYQEWIDKKEYSWSNGNQNWRTFDDKEIELIKNVKK